MNEVTGHLEDQPPIDYFGDMEPVEVAASTIERLTELKRKATELAATIQEQAIDLAELEEQLKAILRTQIPNIMEELGMKEFKMEDGSVVSIIDKINASISEQNRPSAFRWMEEHEYDGIIKTKVVSEFGKGEMEEARNAQEALQNAGFMALLDRSVHPMTLTSFVKERLEAGDKLPESITVFQFKEAKVKEPVVKKPKGSKR